MQLYMSVEDLWQPVKIGRPKAFWSIANRWSLDGQLDVVK